MTYNELMDSILTAQDEMLKHKIEANSVTLNGRKYGKLIENCPPNMKPTIFGMAVKADYALPDDYDFLLQYEPPQPKTNGDRIRTSTDEELARRFATGDWAPVEVPDIFNHEDSYRFWLNWLKQEMDGNGEL